MMLFWCCGTGFQVQDLRFASVFLTSYGCLLNLKYGSLYLGNIRRFSVQTLGPIASSWERRTLQPLGAAAGLQKRSGGPWGHRHPPWGHVQASELHSQEVPRKPWWPGLGCWSSCLQLSSWQAPLFYSTAYSRWLSQVFIPKHGTTQPPNPGTRFTLWLKAFPLAGVVFVTGATESTDMFMCMGACMCVSVSVCEILAVV